jgi:hypothetical protein
MVMANYKADTKQLATVVQELPRRRDLAQAGQNSAPDVAMAIGAPVGDLAKGSDKFDDVSVNVISESAPDGSTKSTFAFRAYRHRKT